MNGFFREKRTLTVEIPKKLLIGKNRALRWSISGMGKQKYTVAEPNFERQEN